MPEKIFSYFPLISLDTLDPRGGHFTRFRTRFHSAGVSPFPYCTCFMRERRMCKPVFFKGLFGVGGKLAKKCGVWLNGVSLFFPRGKKGSGINEERGNWKHSRGLFFTFFCFFFPAWGHVFRSFSGN